ncbi:hypothetical protein KY290_027932 [Solanum tuberosum]|uniref:Uncharacterized protein n=1 Tax=Solanum tuberosum TaxID=4113 RepID=A0ABQ7UGE4_SOLTU|nr:hypothetical protein KY290_027932 [Solanum tuberosum]
MPEMALWVAASHRDGLVVNFYSACWKVRPDLFPDQPTQYPREGRLLAAAETADNATGVIKVFFALSLLWTGALVDTGREQAKRVVRNEKKDTTTSPLCWTAGANIVVSD